MNRRDAALTLALVLTTLVWGSAFTAIKVVVRVLHPVDLAVLRFLVSGLGFAFVLLIMSRRGLPVTGLSVRQRVALIVLGFFGVVAYHVALNIGEDRLTQTASADTAAILSGFLISTNSLFTMVLAPFVTRERLGGRRVAGILVGLVGTAVLVLWGRGVLVDGASLVGTLIVVLAPLSWAFYTVLSKRTVRGLHPLVLTSWASIFGTFLLLPLASPSIVEDASALEAEHWGWILLLAAGATVGGYTAWMYALTHWDATRVSTFAFLVPLFGVLVATWIEGERLTAQIALGGALILVGVYVANSAGRAATARPPSSAGS